MKQLRPHQTRAIEMVRAELYKGHRRVCLVLATGGGKSLTAATMAATHVAKGGRVLWLAHREELCSQAYDTLAELGLSCGIIMADASGQRVNPLRPVQVASIQTLIARQVFPQGITLVIWDECHHTLADSWGELLTHYPNAIVLGLTATPERSDRRGLGDHFDAMVVPVTAKELVAEGLLVPCEILRPKRPLGSKEIAQSPADAYKEHALGRQAVCFAPHTKAAEQYLAEFRALGIRADFISYESPNRSEILRQFKQKELDVLINLAILCEGWDHPEIGVCILARTCGHVGLYLQIVGRVLRPYPGKQSALLLDLTGQSHLHGKPDDDREFSLDGEPIRRKGEKVEGRLCAVCGTPIDAGAQICGACGRQAPEMLPPTVTGDPLVKFAWVRENHDEKRRKSNYIRWALEALNKGQKIARAYYRFKSTYGIDPPFMWSREATALYESQQASRPENPTAGAPRPGADDAQPTLFDASQSDRSSGS